MRESWVFFFMENMQIKNLLLLVLFMGTQLLGFEGLSLADSDQAAMKKGFIAVAALGLFVLVQSRQWSEGQVLPREKKALSQEEERQRLAREEERQRLSREEEQKWLQEAEQRQESLIKTFENGSFREKIRAFKDSRSLEALKSLDKDFDSIFSRDWMMLHEIVKSNEFSSKEKVNILVALHAKKADFLRQDRNGDTVMHYAVYTNDPFLVKVVLDLISQEDSRREKLHPVLGMQNNDGHTPGYTVCRLYNKWKKNKFIAEEVLADVRSIKELIVTAEEKLSIKEQLKKERLMQEQLEQQREAEQKQYREEDLLKKAHAKEEQLRCLAEQQQKEKMKPNLVYSTLLSCLAFVNCCLHSPTETVSSSAAVEPPPAEEKTPVVGGVKDLVSRLLAPSVLVGSEASRVEVKRFGMYQNVVSALLNVMTGRFGFLERWMGYGGLVAPEENLGVQHSAGEKEELVRVHKRDGLDVVAGQQAAQQKKLLQGAGVVDGEARIVDKAGDKRRFDNHFMYHEAFHDSQNGPSFSRQDVHDRYFAANLPVEKLNEEAFEAWFQEGTEILKSEGLTPGQIHYILRCTLLPGSELSLDDLKEAVFLYKK